MAPLADIVALARKYRAQVFVDECHATGFLGPTGRGTDEYWGVRGQVDIINSTLGKALGGATGEAACCSLLIVSRHWALHACMPLLVAAVECITVVVSSVRWCAAHAVLVSTVSIGSFNPQCVCLVPQVATQQVVLR